MNIIDSHFKNNTSIYAGAIYNYLNMSMSIFNSIFINNSANITGGAIYNNGKLILSNNSMSANIAGVLGNVIYNGGQIGVLNLTFIDNCTAYPSSDVVSIFAILTDDMSNHITGQNICFTIDGMNVINVNAVEDEANFIYTFVHD